MWVRSVSLFCFISVVLVFFSVLVSVSGAETARKVERAALSDSMRAALQVKAVAIFKRSCAVSGCHTGKHPEAKLVLDRAGMLKATKNVPSRQISSLMRVDTEKPEKSYLLMKIRGDAGIRGQRMPRGGLHLKNEEIKTIELWIRSLSLHKGEKSDSVG